MQAQATPNAVWVPVTIRNLQLQLAGLQDTVLLPGDFSNPLLPVVPHFTDKSLSWQLVMQCNSG